MTYITVEAISGKHPSHIDGAVSRFVAEWRTLTLASAASHSGVAVFQESTYVHSVLLDGPTRTADVHRKRR